MKTVIAVLLMLVSTGLVRAQTGSADSDPARLDSLRREGYELLYNLDYEGARHRFRQIIKQFPDHPAGPQCFAASLWLQQLNESWELKATLYNNDSFTRSRGELERRQSKEFREWTSRAKMLSEVRLRRDPRDTEALYFLGAAEGLESAFAAAVERRFMAALRTGSHSVERHREVLKLAPDFHDAALTIGLYNFIVGSLPLPLKLLAGSMGMRGSKKRGLETLERVSKEGHWARDLARVVLVDLYKREKRWPDAAAAARELSERYPRNYLFKLQLADALVSQIAALRQSKNLSVATTVEQREVVQIFESLLGSKTAARSDFDLIHFRYGEALFAIGQPERAVKEFLAVVTHAGVEPGLKTMSRLRCAQSLDLVGKRSEALVEYRAVLGSEDINHAHEQARRGLREPYRRK